MTDFELGLARDLVERCGERLETVLEELQAMSVEEPVPYEARSRLAQVLHDLTSVRKYLQRHIPATSVAGDAG
jgi:ABC-type protease/lipase transport system fused ATPase/permease subunit